MSIEYQGEVFISQKEAAGYFRVSVPTFVKKYSPYLTVYDVPGWGRKYYKKSDLDTYQGPRVIR